MKVSIYAIVAIEGNDEEPPLYIGSTKKLRNRNWDHISRCNNPNDKAFNKPLYKFIRDNGGLNNFIMVELVNEEVETKQDVFKLERTYIELLKPSLNKCIPGKMLEMGKKGYRKEWYDNNREEEKQKMKCYYETNKEQLLKRQKEYYKANKEERKQQMKNINYQKVICPHCKVEIMKGYKWLHQRTKKHQQNIQNQEQTE